MAHVHRHGDLIAAICCAAFAGSFAGCGGVISLGGGGGTVELPTQAPPGPVVTLTDVDQAIADGNLVLT